MEITLHIPDVLAARFGAASGVERCALEALALEAFRLGHLTRAELKQTLGFETRGQLDAFLLDHGLTGRFTKDDLARDRADLDRLGLCRPIQTR